MDYFISVNIARKKRQESAFKACKAKKPHRKTIKVHVKNPNNKILPHLNITKVKGSFHRQISPVFLRYA